MTPLDPKTPARLSIRATLLGAFGTALLVLAFALPANATPAPMVTICHATGSETNPYVEVTASAAGIYNGHIAPGHQDVEDIIPVFVYLNVTYSQNLDANATILLANHCVVPGETSTETPTETSTETETPSETETSTETDPPTEEVPFFTSPLTLMAGVGGALAGTLLMLRRKL